MLIEIIDRMSSASSVERDEIAFIVEGLNTVDGIDIVLTDITQMDETKIEELKNYVLPVTFVDNKVVKEGAFFAPEEFMAYTGVFFELGEEHLCDEGCACGHH